MVDFPQVLEKQMESLGKGYVLAGSLKEAGGLAVLGPTEGDITITLNPTYDDLTFPELAGDAIVKRRIKGFNPVVTAPLLTGYAEAYPVLFSGTETSIVVISEKEFKDGLAYDGSWTAPASAPKHAFWMTRAKIVTPGPTFGDSQIGKRTMNVEIQGLVDFDLAWDPDAGVFDRHFIWGDPAGKIDGLAI